MGCKRGASGPGKDGLEHWGDETLVRAARDGSRPALATLFRRYAADVYRSAYRLTGAREDAEDVLQDVFVGLPRALRRYEERGRFLAWLRRVTARVALSSTRTAKRRAFVPLDETSDSPGALGSDEGRAVDPVDRLAVQRALAAMPEPLRIVFVLKEVEGYDHPEIADLLAITPGAARVRLHRAWRFLRSRFPETS